MRGTPFPTPVIVVPTPNPTCVRPRPPAPTRPRRQANGAGNRRLMRLLLVRAVLVCWAICTPLVALWGHAEALLLALGQSPVIAASAATYLAALAPSMFLYVLSECLQTFLVVQVRAGRGGGTAGWAGGRAGGGGWGSGVGGSGDVAVRPSLP